jgi:hypothetical protein
LDIQNSCILHHQNGGRASVTREKTRTMEYYLNEYTYRECCGESIRACDGCDCYECETCGELNFEECAPNNGYECIDCYTFRIEEEC